MRARIRESQEWTQFKVNGKYYERVRFGKEPWFKDRDDEGEEVRACPLCSVPLNHYHLLGCFHEQSTWICDCRPVAVRVIDCKCDAEKDE